MCDTEKSTSQDRRVVSYLKPQNYQLVEGFVKANDVSESAAINMIVRDFFNRLPDHQKADYLSRARTQRDY